MCALVCELYDCLKIDLKRLLINSDLFHLRWNSGTNIFKSSSCNANIYSQGSTIDKLIPISRQYFYFTLLVGDPNLVSCLLQPTSTHFGRAVFFIENRHSS